MIDQRVSAPDGTHGVDRPGGFAILDRRVSRRDVLRFLALSGVSGAVLAACGSTVLQSPTAEPSTPPPTATAASTRAPTVAPTAAATGSPATTDEPTPEPTSPPRGGTIRVGAFDSGLVEGWLTWKSAGLEFVRNWCAQRLLSVAPDGTILYDLAASHTVSDDALEYTFVLADGATWHDGTPVTARDVAFTYNTGLKARAGSTIARLLATIAGSAAVIDDNAKDASGIQVVDDRTIRFVLDQPNAEILPTVFGAVWIMPRHPFEGVALEDYATLDIATRRFIGSGPYQIVEADPHQYVTLEAFDDYANGSGWKGRPRADRVLIRIYEDAAAQLTSTQAGEVDFQFFPRLTAHELTRLTAIRGMAAQKSLVGLNHFYSFNLNDPSSELIRDKRFRQATVWAIERETLVKDVLGGVMRLPDVMNHWIAPWANSEDLERYHPWDVQKARDLLTEIGWNPNHVVKVAHYPPKLEPDVPVIVEMWNAVGIRTELTPIPDAEFVRMFFADTDLDTEGDQGPDFDIAFAYAFGTLDGSPWRSDLTLGSTHVYPNGSNSMRWRNEEWDTNFADALRQPTQEKQAPFFKRCSEIFNDELPYVPLYQRVAYAIVDDNLRGPEKASILHPAAGGVRYWEWYMADA